MSYGKVRGGLIALAFVFLAVGANAESQQKIAYRNKESQADQRGTLKQPLAVDIVRAEKSKEEALQEQADRAAKSANDQWGVGLGVAQLSVFMLQLVVFGLQASRLRQTVEEMRDAKGITKNAADAAIRAAVATEKTVEAMEQTAERQLRAYCLVCAARLDNAEIGKIPCIQITIKNFGSTPARNVSQWSNVGFDTFPPTLSPPPGVEAKEIPAFVVGPGGVFYATPKFNQVVTRDGIEKLKNGTHAIYVIGSIQYEDAFGKTRTTKYKMYSGGNIGLSEGMAACDDGNDYN